MVELDGTLEAGVISKKEARQEKKEIRVQKKANIQKTKTEDKQLRKNLFEHTKKEGQNLRAEKKAHIEAKKEERKKIKNIRIENNLKVRDKKGNSGNNSINGNMNFNIGF
jgi:hypothetical protein